MWGDPLHGLEAITGCVNHKRDASHQPTAIKYGIS
ncbi:Uncharacterised protein [Vibrio cholerae]|nr:Uncharacterised protein [Vibrio cholerae]CSI51735.1 Uncharacterised protein [Vibrio cholerae]CSI56981.1 Uncharacterised protein [Vibrio cholerae]